jgi:hypothetical protein
MKKFLHQIRITALFLAVLHSGWGCRPPQSANHGAAHPIDRQALVTRHNIRVTSSSELQVGNGEFAITTDLSGLISFSNSAILAHWGWHSDPLPFGQTIDDFQWPIHRGYDGRERPYPLPDGSEISNWLMRNPHKANLGRLGLVLIREDGSAAGLEFLLIFKIIL